MTDTAWASIGVGIATIWLLVMTVAVMLCVRQLGALTARMEIVSLGSGVGQGAALGFRISEDLARAHAALSVGRRVVLVASSSCASCRDLLQRIERGERPLSIGRLDGVIGLLVGPDDASRQEAEDALSSLVNEIVLDPLATAVAQALRMKTLPSALYLIDGVVAGTLMFVDRLEQIDDMVREADLGAGEIMSWATATTAEDRESQLVR